MNFRTISPKNERRARTHNKQRGSTPNKKGLLWKNIVDILPLVHRSAVTRTLLFAEKPRMENCSGGRAKLAGFACSLVVHRVPVP